MEVAQILMFVGAMIVVLCLGPLFVMLGWHLFAVPVFGMKGLTFLQALGLLLITGGTRGISYNKK